VSRVLSGVSPDTEESPNHMSGETSIDFLHALIMDVARAPQPAPLPEGASSGTNGKGHCPSVIISCMICIRTMCQQGFCQSMVLPDKVSGYFVAVLLRAYQVHPQQHHAQLAS
jgi:hypothetical protein